MAYKGIAGHVNQKLSASIKTETICFGSGSGRKSLWRGIVLYGAALLKGEVFDVNTGASDGYSEDLYIHLLAPTLRMETLL